VREGLQNGYRRVSDAEFSGMHTLRRVREGVSRAGDFLRLWKREAEPNEARAERIRGKMKETD